MSIFENVPKMFKEVGKNAYSSLCFFRLVVYAVTESS